MERPAASASLAGQANGNIIESDTISNLAEGILIESSLNLVGGSSTKLGNVISNNVYGIQLTTASAKNNLIQGNTLGLVQNSSGTGNQYGVEFDTGANNNVVGADVSTGTPAGQTDPSINYSSAKNAGNQIAYNTMDGVLIAASAGTGNTVRANAILLNGLDEIPGDSNFGRPVAAGAGQGIDRAGTQASAPPVPTVTGAVLFQNKLTVQGFIPGLSSYPGATFRIDLYSQTVSNPRDITTLQPTPANQLSPAPQGDFYLGSIVYDPSMTNGAPFNFVLSNPSLVALVQNDQFVTATVTVVKADTPALPNTPKLSVGDTSTFSSPVIVSNGLQVTTSTDNGNNAAPTPGSLRSAIINANALAAMGASSTIVFNIPTPPGTDPSPIELMNPLPAIVAVSTLSPPQPVTITIDGFTQTSGMARQTTTGGLETPAVIKIVLDGSTIPNSLMTPGNGLTIGGGLVTIRGLDFKGFQSGSAAILVTGTNGAQIAGNMFGSIDDTIGNAGDGIEVLPTTSSSVTNLVIGGPNVADRNIIDGNGTGIEIKGVAGSTISGVAIEGNFIGLETDGMTPFGNGNGILIGGAAGVITSTAAGDPGVLIDTNAISGNKTNGVMVSVAGAANVTISNNEIGSNLIKTTTVSGQTTTTHLAGTLDLGNAGDGIHVEGVLAGGAAQGVQITTNLIDEISSTTTGTNGIAVVGAQFTQIVGDSVSGAANVGILVSGGASSTQINASSVTGTSSATGAGYGIEVLGSILQSPGNTTSTSIVGGSISGTKSDGIHVSIGANTSITGLTITNSGGGGVAVGSAQGTSISGTTISNSSLRWDRG